jgi:RHS repeat-associated protein
VCHFLNYSFLGSKERDNETGLDFMEARYYGSVMGRFTSVDPFDPVLGKQGADNKEEAEREFRQYLLEPARWNRYVYALNNPLKYTDPDGMNSITVNLNIIYDERSRYTDEEKKRIRETYIAQAKKTLGNVDINFNITETTGTASNLRNDRTRIESGAREGSLNAFFTKESVHAFSITEKTNYNTGSMFISTGRGGDPRDLTHGIIHALGVATGVNGYSNYPKAELAVEYAQLSLGVLNRRPSYVDNRPLYEYSGYAQAKVGSPPSKHDVRSVFDVIRDGARKYQQSVRRSRDY